jgi:hypothetical protein
MPFSSLHYGENLKYCYPQLDESLLPPPLPPLLPPLLLPLPRTRGLPRSIKASRFQTFGISPIGSNNRSYPSSKRGGIFSPFSGELNHNRRICRFDSILSTNELRLCIIAKLLIKHMSPVCGFNFKLCFSAENCTMSKASAWTSDMGGIFFVLSVTADPVRVRREKMRMGFWSW